VRPQAQLRGGRQHNGAPALLLIVISTIANIPLESGKHRTKPRRLYVFTVPAGASPMLHLYATGAAGELPLHFHEHLRCLDPQAVPICGTIIAAVTRARWSHRCALAIAMRPRARAPLLDQDPC
jgi:hypothetical protein